jgi:hypothetical protein
MAGEHSVVAEGDARLGDEFGSDVAADPAVVVCVAVALGAAVPGSAAGHVGHNVADGFGAGWWLFDGRIGAGGDTAGPDAAGGPGLTGGRCDDAPGGSAGPTTNGSPSE